MFQSVDRLPEFPAIENKILEFWRDNKIFAALRAKNAEGERDPEMHQTKKGNQWFFGMKAHIGVLGFFRPKTTIIAESPAIRGLQEGIAFSEVHIYTNFG